MSDPTPNALVRAEKGASVNLTPVAKEIAGGFGGRFAELAAELPLSIGGSLKDSAGDLARVAKGSAGTLTTPSSATAGAFAHVAK